MPFHERVKTLRKKAGLTQRELARKAGLSQALISVIESGQVVLPSDDVLQKLAVALGIAPEELADWR